MRSQITRRSQHGYATVTGLPWAPAIDGLRNIVGRVNGDGTASIWAITSTVSGGGDQGADPNKLVTITDHLGATTPPASESFTTVRAADFGEVLRGVSFTPGTGAPADGFCGGHQPAEHSCAATSGKISRRPASSFGRASWM